MNNLAFRWIPMTPKQEKFIKEYLLSGNATDAARKAGYSGNDNTLGQTGAQNLKNPEISAAIKKNRSELQKKFKITQEDIVQGLIDIAFLNPTDIVEQKAGGWVFKKKIARDIMKGANFTIYESYQSKADQKKGILKAKLTLHSGDRKGALELLGEHLGMWSKLNVSNQPGDGSDSETGLQRIRRIIQERAKLAGRKGSDDSEGGT